MDFPWIEWEDPKTGSDQQLRSLAAMLDETRLFGPKGVLCFDTFYPMFKKLSKEGSSSRARGIQQLNALAAKFAVISLWRSQWSNFGFNAFYKPHKKDSYQIGKLMHGNCRIARSSYSAVSNVQPIMAKASDKNSKRLPTIVAATAFASAFATNLITQHMLMITAFATNLITQPMFMFVVMAMGNNFLLGMLREHSHRFSPPWLTTVVVTISFIPILCSSVLMPKTNMAIILGVSLMGQVLGSMAEQSRLKANVANTPPSPETETKTEASVVGGSDGAGVAPFDVEEAISLWSYFMSLYGSS